MYEKTFYHRQRRYMQQFRKDNSCGFTAEISYTSLQRTTDSEKKAEEDADYAQSAVTCPPRDGSGKWGAITFTKTELYASLIDDKAALSRRHKDAGGFIDAGDGDVVWIQSPPQELEGLLSLARDRLFNLEGLAIEGNAAIEFLKPDIVIFIFGNDKERWKTGIESLAGISDMVI